MATYKIDGEQINKEAFFRSIDDYRGWWDEYPDPRQWRIHLREKLFKDRRGRSDLTRLPMPYSFDMHEALFSRRWVGKQDWQVLLFAGPNIMLIRMEEHIPQPPSREVAYWNSVLLYGKETVDRWIASLPFKVTPSMPWRGTNGLEIMANVAGSVRVDKMFATQIENNKHRLDCDA